MKEKRVRVFVGLVAGSFLTLIGCARISTQLVEKPRVDLEPTGNRGYLVGSAPASSKPRSTTRQVIETNIELPTTDELNPWRKPLGVAQKTAAVPAPKAIPASENISQPAWEDKEEYSEGSFKPTRPEPTHRRSAAGESYTVKKGDTLQKISDQFYGTTRKWKEIYDANRNALKSPDRLYAGQKLTIPSADEALHQEPETERNFK